MNADTIDDIKKSDGKLKLLMYRSSLASDKAWLAGFEAARVNQDLEQNPFATAEEEYKCWESGWWEGFYNEDYTAKELTDELSILTAIDSNNDYKAYGFNEYKGHSLNSDADTIAPNISSRAPKIKSAATPGADFKRRLLLAGVVLVTFLGMNALLLLE